MLSDTLLACHTDWILFNKYNCKWSTKLAAAVCKQEALVSQVLVCGDAYRWPAPRSTHWTTMGSVGIPSAATIVTLCPCMDIKIMDEDFVECERTSANLESGALVVALVLATHRNIYNRNRSVPQSRPSDTWVFQHLWGGRGRSCHESQSCCSVRSLKHSSEWSPKALE